MARLGVVGAPGALPARSAARLTSTGSTPALVPAGVPGKPLPPALRRPAALISRCPVLAATPGRQIAPPVTIARPVHVRGAIRGASIVDNIDADYDTGGGIRNAQNERARRVRRRFFSLPTHRLRRSTGSTLKIVWVGRKKEKKIPQKSRK